MKLIIHGDVDKGALAEMPDASVDSVVTDPPYGLEFMGNVWDAYSPAGFQEWCESWAAECLRVLKPGGHLLAFGGTRTWHRLTSGIEDAGFEIRDSIVWLYATGFPKSLDVAKAIDKAAGAEREVAGVRKRPGGPSGMVAAAGWNDGPMAHDDATVIVTAPATDAARQWSGWGTALKPASEPIVVARKPLTGTVAATVQRYGTGAINIDACRINPGTPVPGGGGGERSARSAGLMGAPDSGNLSLPHDVGRWPTNVVLSHAATEDGDDACADGCVPGCPVAELDAESGPRGARAPVKGSEPSAAVTAGGITNPRGRVPGAFHGDTGGASRFYPTFRYQAKAPSRERPKVDGVAHPTVKPLALMRWLTRLVTPPGGTVLDPFAGSGTTIEACVAEGFGCVAVEREAKYLPLILARLARRPAVDTTAPSV